MTLKDFRNIILLLLTSIFITVIFPGIISSFSGTFYTDDLKLKIAKPQLEDFVQYEIAVDQLNNQIHTLDRKINSYVLNNYQDQNVKLDDLLKLKDKLISEKLGMNPPINIIPYYLNPQMLLWLGIYAAFFILIYLLVNEFRLKLRITKSILGFSLLIYFFYEWPLWLRNFVLSNKGRTIYAYPNFDIDKLSFFCQEFIIYVFCLLATILIYVSLQACKVNRGLESKNNDTNKFLILSSYYSTAYRNWFIHSSILALGFLSFTGFFWRLVFSYGDQRYIISALNAHVLWALCWIAISLNLFKYMQELDKTKREIIRTDPDDRILKIVMEHQPANNMTLIISGIGSLVTFFLPLLKSLLI